MAYYGFGWSIEYSHLGVEMLTTPKNCYRFRRFPKKTKLRFLAGWRVSMESREALTEKSRQGVEEQRRADQELQVSFCVWG